MSPGYRDAQRWAREQLPVQQLALVRTRPWSALWRVESAEGVWWLKVNGAQTTYEPRLLELLASLGSGLVPECVTHPTQPWSLIADAGPRARDALAGRSLAEKVDFWCVLLPRYAELQQAAGAEQLAGLGVPDLSPGRLLARFDEVTADARWFTADVVPELTANRWQRILDCRPALGRVAERLARGLPPTIQHDDLHDGNVLLDRGTPRVIDWGDAVLAHPFATMLITLSSLAQEWQRPLEDPVLMRVRGAYLEPWRTAGESAAGLREQLDLAVRTGGLARAACWIRALGEPAVGLELDHADAPYGWLSRLADSLAEAG